MPSSISMKNILEALPFRRTKQKDDAADLQKASPLFRLPPEIRARIWYFSLLPVEQDKTSLGHPPHFHVYDTVYDSCTYAEITPEYKRGRRKPYSISPLLLCRASYYEALNYLYDETHFTLVVFAGRPRPRETQEMANNLKHRHSVGTITECTALLQRMRKVTLVIQPGNRPNADDFAARISALLQAMDYCRQASELQLHFNFRYSFTMFKGGEERLDIIFKAFHPLECRAGPILVQSWEWWYPEDPMDARFKALQQAIPSIELLPWKHPEKQNLCLVRGIIGQPHQPHRHATTRGEMIRHGATYAAITTTWLVLSPLTFPLTFHYYRRNKIDKGEW